MKPLIQIEYLSDQPLHIAEVSRLWYAEWGNKADPMGEEQQLNSVMAKANRGSVPFILIAIIANTLADTAPVFAKDLDSRPDLTPWLAAVVTKAAFRIQRVAEQLIGTAASECHRLGYERIYLRTEVADNYFAHRGWSRIYTTTDSDGTPTRISELTLPPVTRR
jgi:GNAT superfamily N-acetyltransferase